jgi:hypothetical protein
MNELTPDEHKILVDAIHDSATVIHKGQIMNEPDHKERAEKYKQLYNSEIALRLDLEKEVEFLNKIIWKQEYLQEYSTPEKIAEDYMKYTADQKRPHPVSHRDIQEAIDKTVKYLCEIRPDVLKVAAVEHLKKLYDIQIALLGRIE